MIPTYPVGPNHVSYRKEAGIPHTCRKEVTHVTPEAEAGTIPPQECHSHKSQKMPGKVPLQD